MSRIRPPDQALAMCAADAGIPPHSVRLIRAARSGRNELFVIGAGGNDSASAYHVKVRALRHHPERWHVERDFQGLLHVAHHMPADPGFGSIRPVGFGMEPRFLLTRFQDGTPLVRLFNAAVRLGRGREQATHLTQRLGRWLAALHASDSRHGNLDLGAYLAEIEARTEGLERTTGSPDHPRRLVRLLEDLAGAARAADPAFLAHCFPVHGDMAPQNFIVSERGVLYPLDFSAFAYQALDRDAAMLRTRLEKVTFLGPHAARAAADLWRRFWDAYVGAGRSADACAFAYACRLIEAVTSETPGRRFALADLASPVRSLRHLRDRLWLRSRLRWLRGLTESDLPPADYVRNRL